MQLKGTGLRIGTSSGELEDLEIPCCGRFSDVTGFGHASIPLTDDPRVSLFLPIKQEYIYAESTANSECSSVGDSSSISNYSASESGHSDDTDHTDVEDFDVQSSDKAVQH
jgi:hypothetical protein